MPRLAALGLVLLVLPVACGRSPERAAIIFSRCTPHTKDAVTTCTYDLYAVAIDSHRIVRLTKTGADESRPAISPDGRVIAFARESSPSGSVDIWTMKIDGTNITRLPASEGGASPAWAPDGRSLYFIRYRETADGPCGSIFRIGKNGRSARQVAQSRGFHSYEDPAVSPDGHTLAFSDWDGCSGGTSQPRLRKVDLLGRPTDDLTRLPRNGSYPNPEHDGPAWSPDGARIAFLLNGRLSVANRDGSSVQTLVSSQLAANDTDRPAWSRDGKWLAFVTQTDDLYIVHPDGHDLRRLIHSNAYLRSPAWLPMLPK